MQKLYLQMQNKSILFNWLKSMVKNIGMDYKSIDYGGNKIKRKRQSFLSVKINNLY